MRYGANENYFTNKFCLHYKPQGSCFVRPRQFKMRNILLSCNQRSSDFNIPNSVAYIYCNIFPEHCIFCLLQVFAFFSHDHDNNQLDLLVFSVFLFLLNTTHPTSTHVGCGTFPSFTSLPRYHIRYHMPIAATLAGTQTPPPQ